MVNPRGAGMYLARPITVNPCIMSNNIPNFGTENSLYKTATARVKAAINAIPLTSPTTKINKTSDNRPKRMINESGFINLMEAEFTANGFLFLFKKLKFIYLYFIINIISI